MTLLDTAMAAAALGVTERTVRRMVVRGQLANHGTARAIRIALEQVIPEEEESEQRQPCLRGETFSPPAAVVAGPAQQA